MMKKYILFIILILCSAVNADLLSTFGEYRNQIRTNLNLATTNTTFMTDSVMNEKIRESVMEVLDNVHGLKREYDFVTTKNVKRYSLDTLVWGVETLRWSKNDSAKSLLHIPQEEWHQLEHKTTKQGVGFLRISSYFDFTDDYLFLSPTPTSVDTFKYTAWIKVPDISAYDSLNIINPKVRKLIVLHATDRIAKAKNYPISINYREYYESAEAKFLNRERGMSAEIK